MWWKLVLLFAVVAALELFVLLQVGSLIGPGPTFLLLLLSGVLGGWLAQREGRPVWRQLSADLQRGLPPGDRLVEGVLVLLGATLLIVPGFLSDLAGLVILTPPIRRRLVPRVARALSVQFGLEEEEPPPGEGVRYRREGVPRPVAAPRPTPFSSPFD